MLGAIEVMKTKRTQKATFGVAVALTVLVLSGCASAPVLAPKGSFASGGHKTTLSRDWSDISTVYPLRAKKVQILTIDGMGLNLLFVSDGLTHEDPLMISPTKGDSKDAPAPRGKSGMSLSEQIEFVANSVTALDYQKVETANPQPVTISGTKGVRFELTAKTSKGLDFKGLAQAVTKGNHNYYIVYLAPAEHYYDASFKDAVAAMDAATLP
jgi:hypothetical protein